MPHSLRSKRTRWRRGKKTREPVTSKRPSICTLGVCVADLTVRSRKNNAENTDEPPESREVTGGNEELRRLDTSSEPGPQNKRARTSEKMDIADKVGIDSHAVDDLLSFSLT